MMNPRNLVIPVLLGALALSGCISLGGGSTGGDGGTTASLSDGGRSTPKVSDSEIAGAIQNAFKQDQQLSGAGIVVKVENGAVTLSGNVPNVQAYLRAGSLARNVPGVRPPVNVSNLRYPL